MANRWLPKYQWLNKSDIIVRIKLALRELTPYKNKITNIIPSRSIAMLLNMLITTWIIMVITIKIINLKLLICIFHNQNILKYIKIDYRFA